VIGIPRVLLRILGFSEEKSIVGGVGGIEPWNLNGLSKDCARNG